MKILIIATLVAVVSSMPTTFNVIEEKPQADLESLGNGKSIFLNTLGFTATRSEENDDAEEDKEKDEPSESAAAIRDADDETEDGNGQDADVDDIDVDDAAETDKHDEKDNDTKELVDEKDESDEESTPIIKVDISLTSDDLESTKSTDTGSTLYDDIYETLDNLVDIQQLENDFQDETTETKQAENEFDDIIHFITNNQDVSSNELSLTPKIDDPESDEIDTVVHIISKGLSKNSDSKISHTSLADKSATSALPLFEISEKEDTSASADKLFGKLSGKPRKIVVNINRITKVASPVSVGVPLKNLAVKTPDVLPESPNELKSSLDSSSTKNQGTRKDTDTEEKITIDVLPLNEQNVPKVDAPVNEIFVKQRTEEKHAAINEITTDEEVVVVNLLADKLTDVDRATINEDVFVVNPPAEKHTAIAEPKSDELVIAVDTPAEKHNEVEETKSDKFIIAVDPPAEKHSEADEAVIAVDPPAEKLTEADEAIKAVDPPAEKHSKVDEPIIAVDSPAEKHSEVDETKSNELIIAVDPPAEEQSEVDETKSNELIIAVDPPAEEQSDVNEAILAIDSPAEKHSEIDETKSDKLIIAVDPAADKHSEVGEAIIVVDHPTEKLTEVNEIIVAVDPTAEKHTEVDDVVIRELPTEKQSEVDDPKNELLIAVDPSVEKLTEVDEVNIAVDHFAEKHSEVKETKSDEVIIAVDPPAEKLTVVNEVFIAVDPPAEKHSEIDETKSEEDIKAADSTAEKQTEVDDVVITVDPPAEKHSEVDETKSDEVITAVDPPAEKHTEVNEDFIAVDPAVKRTEDDRVSVAVNPPAVEITANDDATVELSSPETIISNQNKILEKTVEITDTEAGKTSPNEPVDELLSFTVVLKEKTNSDADDLNETVDTEDKEEIEIPDNKKFDDQEILETGDKSIVQKKEDTESYTIKEKEQEEHLGAPKVSLQNIVGDFIILKDDFESDESLSTENLAKKDNTKKAEFTITLNESLESKETPDTDDDANDNDQLSLEDLIDKDNSEEDLILIVDLMRKMINKNLANEKTTASGSSPVSTSQVGKDLTLSIPLIPHTAEAKTEEKVNKAEQNVESTSTLTIDQKLTEQNQDSDAIIIADEKDIAIIEVDSDKKETKDTQIEQKAPSEPLIHQQDLVVKDLFANEEHLITEIVNNETDLEDTAEKQQSSKDTTDDFIIIDEDSSVQALVPATKVNIVQETLGDIVVHQQALSEEIIEQENVISDEEKADDKIDEQDTTTEQHISIEDTKEDLIVIVEDSSVQAFAPITEIHSIKKEVEGIQLDQQAPTEELIEQQDVSNDEVEVSEEKPSITQVDDDTDQKDTVEQQQSLEDTKEDLIVIVEDSSVQAFAPITEIHSVKKEVEDIQLDQQAPTEELIEQQDVSTDEVEVSEEKPSITQADDDTDKKDTAEQQSLEENTDDLIIIVEDSSVQTLAPIAKVDSLEKEVKIIQKEQEAPSEDLIVQQEDSTVKKITNVEEKESSIIELDIISEPEASPPKVQLSVEEDTSDFIVVVEDSSAQQVSQTKETHASDKQTVDDSSAIQQASTAKSDVDEVSVVEVSHLDKQEPKEYSESSQDSASDASEKGLFIVKADSESIALLQPLSIEDSVEDKKISSESLEETSHKQGLTSKESQEDLDQTVEQTNSDEKHDRSTEVVAAKVLEKVITASLSEVVSKESVEKQDDDVKPESKEDFSREQSYFIYSPPLLEKAKEAASHVKIEESRESKEDVSKEKSIFVYSPPVTQKSKDTSKYIKHDSHESKEEIARDRTSFLYSPPVTHKSKDTSKYIKHDSHESKEETARERTSFVYSPPSHDHYGSHDHIEILKDTRSYGNDGYSFHFETEDGIKRQEYGKRINGDDGPIVHEGEYSFIFPTGEDFHLKYIANEDGFQPESEWLPVGPPVPAFVLRQIEKARLEDLQKAKNHHYESDEEEVSAPSRYYTV